MALWAAAGQLSPVELFGQDLNLESSALTSATLLMHGLDPGGIALGDTLSNDAHPDATFDYMVAAPPFGLEWKKVEGEVKKEAALGDAGRFGAGLPRINDGSLLFLQHMLAKMRPPEDGGSRLAVHFSSSPLFAGALGSGESEIRRWIFENDLLETVVALPERLIYNTRIPTYIWVLTNRKEPSRAGNVILMDCRRHSAAMRRSLADKSRYLTPEQISEITAIRRSATTTDTVAPDVAKVVPVADFRFERVVGGVTRVGYEIRPFDFFSIALGDGFAPLSSVVQVLRSIRRPGADWPLLTAKDFGRPDLSAADLDTVGDQVAGHPVRRRRRRRRSRRLAPAAARVRRGIHPHVRAPAASPHRPRAVRIPQRSTERRVHQRPPPTHRSAGACRDPQRRDVQRQP
jgi:hypothetical protein